MRLTVSKIDTVWAPDALVVTMAVAVSSVCRLFEQEQEQEQEELCRRYDEEKGRNKE